MVWRRMFVRRSRVGQYEYMQLVEGYRREGKPTHRYLASLGRYDERRFREARRLVRELVPLEQAQLIVEELEEVSGPGRGRPYFRKFRRVPR